MARSDDPTTYSQTWQDAPQAYADAAPQQPVYADPQLSYAPAHPVAADPAYYAQPAEAQPGYAEAAYPAPEHQQYADVTQPAHAAVEAYPPLELPASTYAQQPQTQPYQPQPAPESYATYDQAAPAQNYQPAQSYQQSAPQAYEQPAPQAYEQQMTQPAAYQQADPATQQQQSYAQYAPQPAYAEQPAQGYAPVPEQQPSVVYSDYAAPASQHDAYAGQETYAAPAAAPIRQDHFSAGEPQSGATVGYGDFNTQTEPTFGAAQSQEYAPQQPQQYQAAPQGQDPYGLPQHSTAEGLDFNQFGNAQGQQQPRRPDEAFLDPSLFSQADTGHQIAGAGSALDQFGQQHQNDQFQQEQPGLDPHGGFDQRFHTQQRGYDQRFEQPTQGHYDGGLVGDFDGQAEVGGHDMGSEMAPVIANQQMEPTRSRRGLIVVGALVAAVGIGGALGFAYKYSNDSGRVASGTPPTIKASRTAAKEAPASNSGQDGTFGTRLASNRAADTSRTRLQSREEPLAGQQGGVKLRSSTSGQTNSLGTQVTNLQGDNRANVPGVRRVKTLKVNPDGSFAAPAPSAFGSDNSIPGVTLGALPTVTKATAKRIDVPKTLQTARKTVASLPKVTAQIPQPQAVKPRKRVASLQPTAPASVPSTASNSGGGLGFVVQVSARRSRIDALAAFADLQQRYTTALSTKQPDIQEVNLGGNRGKWYRVRIGPPGSKNSAYNLCNRLKKSGLKDCLIKAY